MSEAEEGLSPTLEACPAASNAVNPFPYLSCSRNASRGPICGRLFVERSISRDARGGQMTFARFAPLSRNPDPRGRMGAKHDPRTILFELPSPCVVPDWRQFLCDPRLSLWNFPNISSAYVRAGF
jgi:hypothetical protein